MWTALKSALQDAASRTASRVVLAALVGAMIVLAPAQGRAQAVNICAAFGVGYFFIPGTDTCQDARQITANQFDIARAESRAATGIAMASALVAPWLPTGTNHAVSMHWAGFDGKHALGFHGLLRLNGNLVFSAGFASGFDQGAVTANQPRLTPDGVTRRTQSWSEINGLGRAGFMYAW